MPLQLQPSPAAAPSASAVPLAAFTLAPASEAHAPAMAAIYRAQIEDGLGSHEDPLPDAAEMARRLAEVRAHDLPALVALDGDGEVVGYAWAAPFRAKAHYRHTVEDSVHVDRRARCAGVATALLRRLLRECAERGCRQMVAVVGDARNRASIRLHERLGFRACGYFPSAGRRPGEWCDVVMLQRALGAEASATPS